MGMMAGLDRLEGRAYEIAWLEAMINHHTSAIDMAGHILKQAEHKDLRDLAQHIIDRQTAEVAMMENLIASLTVITI